MALTSNQQKILSDHRKKFGADHARIMRSEMNKGVSTSKAHKKSLRG